MIPLAVLADPRLKPLDIRVYGFLASCRRGEVVTVGARRIASSIHATTRKIGESVDRLAAAGHVATKNSGRGRRNVYSLTSQLFTKNTKNSEEFEQAETSPDLSDTAVKLVACPKCHTRCKGLLRIGWCRSCNWKLKVRRIVREEMAAAS